MAPVYLIIYLVFIYIIPIAAYLQTIMHRTIIIMEYALSFLMIVYSIVILQTRICIVESIFKSQVAILF